MCRSPRKFALVAIQLSLDAAQGCPSIGGCNGANPTLGCSGSPFRRRWFLHGSSISLLWWGARHDTDYRHCGPSLEGLIPLDGADPPQEDEGMGFELCEKIVALGGTIANIGVH